MSNTKPTQNQEPSSERKSNRLISLDALRGFDMLWIMGGERIIVALANLTGAAGLTWAATQMDHVEWNGFHFYDLIFPLFLFIAGVSMPLSMDKRLAAGEKKAKIYRHIRTAVVMTLAKKIGSLVFNVRIPYRGNSLHSTPSLKSSRTNIYRESLLCQL